MSHRCHGIVHVHTFAHTLHLKDVICHVVRCVIPIHQRIWFKGEVGGFALFNFTENCGVGGHGFLSLTGGTFHC